jgi:hypothetical protein
LWRDYAAGVLSTWLDLRTTTRTGQDLFSNYAKILSALAGTATTPATLPPAGSWQERLIFATAYVAYTTPSILSAIARTPTADTDFLHFITKPTADPADFNLTEVPFITFETVGQGAAPEDPSKDLGAAYETVNGSLTGHDGEFILGFCFQVNGAQARFDFSYLVEVQLPP